MTTTEQRESIPYDSYSMSHDNHKIASLSHDVRTHLWTASVSFKFLSMIRYCMGMGRFWTLPGRKVLQGRGHTSHMTEKEESHESHMRERNGSHDRRMSGTLYLIAI